MTDLVNLRKIAERESIRRFPWGDLSDDTYPIRPLPEYRRDAYIEGYLSCAKGLLDRVETAERERDEYRDGTTIVKLTEAERALQRVRELYRPVESYYPGREDCIECSGAVGSMQFASWPCPTIRALEGDE